MHPRYYKNICKRIEIIHFLQDSFIANSSNSCKKLPQKCGKNFTQNNSSMQKNPVSYACLAKLAGILELLAGVFL